MSWDLAGNIRGPAGSGGGGSGVQQVVTFSIPGQLVAGNRTFRWYADEAYTITKVRASVGTAPTGANGVTANVFKNGSGSGSIFSGTNWPIIAANTFTATTTTIQTPGLVAGDYLTFGLANVGGTIPGSDFTLEIYMTKV